MPNQPGSAPSKRVSAIDRRHNEVCDRCHHTAPADGHGKLYGWATIKVTGYSAQHGYSRDLCPRCHGVLVRALESIAALVAPTDAEGTAK